VRIEFVTEPSDVHKNKEDTKDRDNVSVWKFYILFGLE